MNQNVQEWMRARSEAKIKISINDYNNLLALVAKCASILSSRALESNSKMISDADLEGFTPICDEVASEDAFNDLERSLGMDSSH